MKSEENNVTNLKEKEDKEEVSETNQSNVILRTKKGNLIKHHTAIGINLIDMTFEVTSNLL